ncbi:serine/threonine-protein phosphatase 4 regulatory subunit 4-like isoform X1 [Amblyomma americanum]
MVPTSGSLAPREQSCSSPPLILAEDDCGSPDEHAVQPPFQSPSQDGKPLTKLLEGSTLVSQSFAQSLLQSILSSVESRDPVVANAWADTLLDVLELLPRATISQQVLQVAVQKGQASQSSLSRLFSCRLLGALAVLLEPCLVQRELLPLAESLCQDPEPVVRAAVCRQLGALTRSAGLGMTRQHLLPCLVELSSDGDCAVRRAALVMAVTMLGLLDDASCRDSLVSLVVQWKHRPVRELAFLATQMGPLCHLPAGIVDKDGWLLELYQELSTIGLHESNQSSPVVMGATVRQVDAVLCRQACARCFPDFARLVGAESFETKLLITWNTLCTDPDKFVRTVMAEGVSQVVTFLSGQGIISWPRLLLIEACGLLAEGLLADGLSTIAQALLPCRACCNSTCRAGCDDCCTEAELVLLVSSAEACVEQLGLKWRQEAAVWMALGYLAGPLLPFGLQERITRRLLRRIQAAGPLPCRVAAVRSLLAFLQRSPSGQEELLKDIIQGLAQGRSCRSRLMFIQLCSAAEDIRALMQWRLLQHLHRLAAEDPVESVRREASRCLAQLESIRKAEQRTITTPLAGKDRIEGTSPGVCCGTWPVRHRSSRLPVSVQHFQAARKWEKIPSSPHLHNASVLNRALPPPGKLAARSGMPSRIPVLDCAYRCKRQLAESVSKEDPS